MISFREVTTEAWRNIVSGTTRAFTFLGVFVMLVGGIVVLQVRALVAVDAAAAQFVNSGSAIQVVTGPSGISGAQCEALASYAGISAAGAIRSGEDLRLAVLPSTTTHTFEATPGLASVLGILSDAPALGGVWVSQDLANVVGVGTAPTVLSLSDGGSIDTAGVYPYPSDGRSPALGYALVSPVPAEGVFDACWVRIWPESDAAFSLLMLPVIRGGQTNNSMPPQAQQLNTTLGVRFDAARRLDAEPMMPLSLAAVGIGFVVGATAIRVRRLELASAMHVGVDKVSLLVQVELETLVWAGLGCLLLLPALGLTVTFSGVESLWAAWYPGIRSVLCAGVATLLGAAAATLATSENQLFNYFKQR